jgi:hypothetical protein
MATEFSSPGRRAQNLVLLVLLVLAWLGGACSRALALQSVELSWNPSPAANIVAYNVYYGTESGFYTDCITFSDVTDVVILGLESGETYYFAVSATDASGLESGLSNEASYTVPVPVPIVLQTQAALADRGVELTWNASPAGDIVGFNVYYGTQSGVYSAVIGVSGVTDTIIPELEPGKMYYFLVAAVDDYGEENDFSNEGSCVVPVPAPIVLQTQAFNDGSGQSYLRINTLTAVSGYWEMDCSTDLQNWFAYACGYGSGNGDGHDVEAYVWPDPTQAQMFFRVINY